MKKMNWKVIGGIVLVIAIIALVVYKPWMSDAEKAKRKAEAEKKKKDDEAAKALGSAGATANAGTKTSLISTPFGKASFVSN